MLTKFETPLTSERIKEVSLIKKDLFNRIFVLVSLVVAVSSIMLTAEFLLIEKSTNEAVIVSLGGLAVIASISAGYFFNQIIIAGRKKNELGSFIINSLNSNMDIQLMKEPAIFAEILVTDGRDYVTAIDKNKKEIGVLIELEEDSVISRL